MVLIGRGRRWLGMLRGTRSFNQSLDSWNVSNVTDMSCMFDGASKFNQPLSSVVGDPASLYKPQDVAMNGILERSSGHSPR